MHITIASNALADALKSSVAGGKSTMPILAHALLSARGDGRVSFLTTDLEVFVETFADAEIHEGGEQCLQASLLRPVVQQDGDIRIKDDVLTRGRSRYRVPGYDSAQFPRPDHATEWQRLTLDPLALAAAINAVAYAVDSTSPQAHFRGVMVVPGCVWGTTGNRGARVSFAYDGPVIAIPAHQAPRVVDVLAPDVEIHVGNVHQGRAGLLRITSPDGAIVLRLYDIVPIDFERATPLPPADAPFVTFRTDQLRLLVRRFLPFTEIVGNAGKFLTVELRSDKDEVTLCDRSGDNRENLTEAVVELSGPFRTNLNPKFLLDALTAVKSPQVYLFPGAAAQRINFRLMPVSETENAAARVELHMFAGLL